MLKVLRPYFFIQRSFLSRTEMERVLILSSLFSIALSFARVIYTGQLTFLSLIWNLFLAFVPFCISRYLMHHPQWIEHRLKFLLASFIWLLFIPNSFYIITDLFHLFERPEIPLWFDLVLIFSFAWNGLLLGVISLRQMERIIETKWKWSEAFFVYPIMCLNAFGIYLGRYLRYNSWDIVSSPFQLASDIIYLFVHPIRNRFDWSMIMCFSVFMTLLYLSLKRINK